jgi:hypothetical protein
MICNTGQKIIKVRIYCFMFWSDSVTFIFVYFARFTYSREFKKDLQSFEGKLCLCPVKTSLCVHISVSLASVGPSQAIAFFYLNFLNNLVLHAATLFDLLIFQLRHTMFNINLNRCSKRFKKAKVDTIRWVVMMINYIFNRKAKTQLTLQTEHLDTVYRLRLP